MEEVSGSPSTPQELKTAAINAVTAYCGVKKRVSCRRGRSNRPIENKIPTVIKIEKPAQSRSDIALNQTILSIRTEKRPTIYFLYFRNPNLPIGERAFSFLSSRCLSKHFWDKYIKRLETRQKIECKHCDVNLVDRMYLQNYAEKFHETVLRVFK